jgi:hypothetical protein
MRVSSSAGAQNVHVGIRERRGDRRRRGQHLDVGLQGLAAEIERGWRYFWRQRGIEPPPVSRTAAGLLPLETFYDRGSLA